MKVALPTMGDSRLEEVVTEHFGGAAYCTSVDTEMTQVEVMANNSEDAGGHSKPTHEMVSAASRSSSTARWDQERSRPSARTALRPTWASAGP